MKRDRFTVAHLWEEIKRRKVVRVVIAYLIVGWGLIQIADATLEPLHLPQWAGTMVVWLVGLGFPIAVILAWVLDVTPRGIEVTPPADEGSHGGKRAAEKSIAVLPFVNISGDPENEYFSDGLSEELLNVLTRLQSLRVCSRTSSFSLKGKDLDMPTAAAQLGVRHVLEGSVRRSGNTVRITAQLIDAAEDCHLWSETYDRELQDIFVVQDEIAQHILTALKLTLTAHEEQAIRQTTDNVQAFDYYMRGREHYHRSDPGHLDRSRQCFEEAIKLDPDYALAWAGLAYVFVDIYWYKHKEARWLEGADEASRKSVEFAPHLAESHAARGYALFAAENFEGAKLEFQKAIAINPRLFEPLHFYAQMLRTQDKHELAAEMFCRAADVRPEDFQALAVAASMYKDCGDEQASLNAANESIERARRAIELNPDDVRALSLGATILHMLDRIDEALEWSRRSLQISPENSGALYNAACLHALLGKSGQALDLLEQAVDYGARNKRYFETDSDFDCLRDDPRFKALLDRI